jgi:hypothetical protein
VLAAAGGCLGCGRLWSAGSGIHNPSGLIQAEMPGIAVDQAGPATRRMRLDAAWPEEDPDAFGPQRLDAAPERDAGSERRVDEREDCRRHAQAGGLREYA